MRTSLTLHPFRLPRPCTLNQRVHSRSDSEDSTSESKISSSANMDRFPPVDQAVELLTIAFAEPHREPPACAYVLTLCRENFMRASQEARSNGISDHVAYKWRTILDRCLRFLSTPRTHQQLTFLRSAFESQECRCYEGPKSPQRIPHARKHQLIRDVQSGHFAAVSTFVSQSFQKRLLGWSKSVWSIQL
jgi:hypothetical protein